jgi:hypothetical protein
MKLLRSHCISLTILLPGLLFLVMQANGQVRVTKISSPQDLQGKKGLVYTLPRTYAEVEIVVAKTRQIPGPLAEYAREFLGTSDVVTKETSEYSIGSASVTFFREPDPNQIYMIEKEEKAQGEIWIGFGPENKTVCLEKFPKESSPKGFSEWDNASFQQFDTEGIYSKYSSSAVREKVDTIIRKISIDTLVIEEKMLKRSMVEYPARDKAQEAIDQVHRIESDMYNLLIGYQETPYSKDALEFMYSRLEKERQDYLSLFTGVTVNENLVFQFRVNPDPSKDSQAYPIAGFTTTGGLVAVDDQNTINLLLTPEKTWSSLSDAAASQGPKGIVYRIPVIVPYNLDYKGKSLASGNFQVDQFGSLLALPPEFKKVELNLETGSIRSVVME